MIQNIRLQLGDGRSVLVAADVHCDGTEKRYRVRTQGVELVGYWDMDARHDIECECPDNLRERMLSVWANQQAAAARKELAAMPKDDRRYFESLRK